MVFFGVRADVWVVSDAGAMSEGRTAAFERDESVRGCFPARLCVRWPRVTLPGPDFISPGERGDSNRLRGRTVPLS